jgi:glycosyltransferase involved in cell wall biosynthesis
MIPPLVSVLIPCFNAERFIGETLESVFRQTWPEIEIIVVNDGSTDNSIFEVRRFSDTRLRVVDRPHSGAAKSRNEAFRISRGAFIQYLDADDLISPRKIELQMQRLANSVNCLASSEWGRFYKCCSETEFRKEKVWQDLAPVDWLAISRCNGLGMMFPALWLIPRSIVDAAGLWNEDISVGDDTEFFTRVLLRCERVLFCAGARCFYRSGIAGSLSGRRSTEAWESQFQVTELCQQYVLAREDSDRVRRGFAQSWQHLAHICYPYDRRMAFLALNKARALHPVQINPDGGLLFRNISRLVGWRIARILQVAIGRQ